LQGQCRELQHLCFTFESLPPSACCCFCCALQAVPDLKKVTGFVHDLEAVVVSTVEQLRVDMPWVADIPCVAHGLHNFVKDLSGLPLFKEVFDDCHTMIKTILEHKDLRAK
jgi:hypothetical protein